MLLKQQLTQHLAACRLSLPSNHTFSRAARCLSLCPHTAALPQHPLPLSECYDVPIPWKPPHLGPSTLHGPCEAPSLSTLPPLSSLPRILGDKLLQIVMEFTAPISDTPKWQLSTTILVLHLHVSPSPPNIFHYQYFVIGLESQPIGK